MYSSTEAIVLQLHPYKDNSAVVKLYTRQSGLISCWVRSAHNKTSKTKAAIMQSLSIIKAEISYRKNNNLPQLKETSLAQAAHNIQMSVEKRSIAMFLCELLIRTVKESSVDEHLYDFIRDAITLLNETDKGCSNFHILFLVKFSELLGFLPREDFSSGYPYFDLQEGAYVDKEPLHPHFLLPAETKLLNSLSSLSMEEFYKAELTSSERKKLLHGLLEYFRLHLGTAPLKSHLVLEEIFE
jgi:DNA repair protein RecO (recombination protein O)